MKTSINLPWSGKCLAIFCLIVSICIAARPQSLTNRPETRTIKAGELCAVSITTSKTNYAPGEQVMVNMSVKNTGNQAIALLGEPTVVMFKVEMFAPRKQRAPLTASGQRALKVLDEAGTGGSVLKSGNVSWYELPITDDFDLSARGAYVIEAVRKFELGPMSSTNREWLQVTSNVVRIHVN